MILIYNLTMMKFLSRLHVQYLGDSHSGCKRKTEVIAPRFPSVLSYSQSFPLATHPSLPCSAELSTKHP